MKKDACKRLKAYLFVEEEEDWCVLEHGFVGDLRKQLQRFRHAVLGVVLE
jgi:hypothetical protein